MKILIQLQFVTLLRPHLDSDQSGKTNNVKEVVIIPMKHQDKSQFRRILAGWVSRLLHEDQWFKSSLEPTGKLRNERRSTTHHLVNCNYGLLDYYTPEPHPQGQEGVKTKMERVYSKTRLVKKKLMLVLWDYIGLLVDFIII